MKATEIVEKLKSVLLSSDETQEIENIELSEEVVEQEEVELQEELAEEGEEDMPSEEEAPVEPQEEEMKWATKEELEGAVAEMRAMYQALIDELGSKEMEAEVPTEEELNKEELSSQVEEVEPISHSPESVENNVNLGIRLSQNRQMSTLDRVFSQINSIKK
jgi:hypothetical protein